MLDSPASSKKRRPIAITIVGVLLIVTAFLNIALGVFLVWVNNVALPQGTNIMAELELTDGDLTDPVDILFEGVIYTVLGIVQLVIGIGFWRLARWAWVAAMSWQALKLLLELLNFFIGEIEPVSLIFAILLVLLLNQSDVRRVFGILQHESESSSTAPNRPLDVN